jgi:hypothetical protein
LITDDGERERAGAAMKKVSLSLVDDEDQSNGADQPDESNEEGP